MKKMVQIFGERCSGTNYLEDLLLANCDVDMTSSYGHKHMFNKFQPRKSPDTDAVYIFMYRNPYDWLRSLNEKPHHTRYWDTNFSTFIRQAPWTCDIYTGSGFKGEYGNVIEQYDGNVIHLRNEKNKVFSKLWIPTLSVNVRYEDLRRHPYEELTSICQMLGISMFKQFNNIITSEKGSITYTRKMYNTISQKDLDFINENLAWDEENRIGYHRINSANSLDTILHMLYG